MSKIDPTNLIKAISEIEFVAREKFNDASKAKFEEIDFDGRLKNIETMAYWKGVCSGLQAAANYVQIEAKKGVKDA